MLSKPALIVSGGRNALTSTSRSSRLADRARVLGAVQTLEACGGRDSGCTAAAVSMRVSSATASCFSAVAVGTARAGRRHHPGAQLADHLLADFRVVRHLRDVERGEC